MSLCFLGVSFFFRHSYHVRRRHAPQRFFPGDIVLQRGVDDFFLAPTFACEGLEVMCVSDELKCSDATLCSTVL